MRLARARSSGGVEGGAIPRGTMAVPQFASAPGTDSSSKSDVVPTGKAIDVRAAHRFSDDAGRKAIYAYL